MEERAGKSGGDGRAGGASVRADLGELYVQMRGLARAQMARERRDHTLQATALVHEAYVRLVKRPGFTGQDRGRWLAAAAEEMRRILIDHARARGAAKRGGDRARADLELENLAELAAREDPTAVLALDRALAALEKLDARAADVVRLRFFLGMSPEQTAAALDVSERSVLRDWKFARAYLAAEMAGSAEDGGGRDAG